MLLFIILSVGVDAISYIQNDRSNDLCIVYEMTSFGTSFNNANDSLVKLHKHMGLKYEVCKIESNANALTQMQKCNCIYDDTPQIVVFTNFKKSSLKTLIGTENKCELLPQTTIYTPTVDIESEYFIYGNDVKICYLDKNLLGIGCDATDTTSWLDLDAGLPTNHALDIPEITSDGFKLFAKYSDSFLCQRLMDEPKKQIQFYAEVDNVPSNDVIESSRSWASVWKVVKTVLHFTYHILDLFYGNRRATARMIEHSPLG
ncbi:VP7 [Adult diarrheal rotavirus strain J19]|uniref:Outer capsid glycoprotein VP7 n=1 Tax=Rotavirus X (strain RVX/Human/China/NADRV-J19/1997/GXP[X]) TaxID=335103 RepID=VP7_ROTJ1|nr:VP7 [Adult diarrheal rotavirus strain J19]Q45UF2.1 RecName: Full=Outer capsid glycoprotein VP7 [Adult diarrheal rotavirus strain J19]AAZ03493.1 VP7 [Adult diarrheal rotavirus strain J19]